MIVALAVVSPFVLHGIGHGDFLFNNDEPSQAVTGIFIADLIRAFPIHHATLYAYAWYAHYPNLGILIWPPLFHTVEALFYMALGISAVTARLAIYGFALFGLVFWFRLVRELAGERAALAALVLLALLPRLLLFEQSVMLEVPALALAVAAIFFWFRYLDSKLPRPLYTFAVLAALCLLTKENCIFLAVFCVLTLLVERKLRWIVSAAMLRAIAIVLVIAGPYYTLSLKVLHHFIGADVVTGQGFTFRSWWTYVYYLHVLVYQAGIPVVVLAVVGAVTWRRWTKAAAARRMAMWLLAVYLTFLVIPHKESRYVIYWLPAAVFFAVGPLVSGRWPKRVRTGGVATLAALLIFTGWEAWRFERPYVSGYKAVAERVIRSGRGGFVEYDGLMPGDFIFYMRALDPSRSWVVLRKELYVHDWVPAWGSKQLVHSQADVRTVLARYGVRYVVVDNSPPMYQAQTLLREVVHQPPYRLLAAYPVSTNVSDIRGETLYLYENPQAAPPTAKELVLPMMTISHSIRIPMNELKLGR